MQDEARKKRYEEAFRLFSDLELVLLDEKQLPTNSFKMASTWADLKRAADARRAKRPNGTFPTVRSR